MDGRAAAVPGKGGPVRVVVCGYGHWGAQHARVAICADGVRLAGIVEPRHDRRAAALARFGIPAWPALADALAAAPADAVIIATPASTHLDLAMRALRSGRHVLVEKPAVTNAADARSLIAVARERGCQLAVGHTFLHSQPIRNIADWLRLCAPEQPWLIRSERLGAQRREDCGVLWNLAPHDVSILLHLISGRVTQVSARTRVLAGGKHADVAAIDLNFSSGVRGEIYVGWRHPGTKRALRVIGADWALRYREQPGGVVVDVQADHGLGAEADAVLHSKCAVRGDGLIGGYQEPLRAQLEAFARACRGGEPLPNGPAHLLSVTRALQAAELSAAEDGRTIAVDPDDELDAEACHGHDHQAIRVAPEPVRAWSAQKRRSCE